MIQGIRHIIFDLGGVLLNLDYTRTEKAFIELGIHNFNELYSQLRQTSLFDDWEIGRITKDEFLNKLIEIAPAGTTADQVIYAWNAMLMDFPMRRLQLLQQLRAHYDLLLLSNTNELHELAFNEILLQSHGLPGLGVFFDKVYYSHRIGMRKPGQEVFRYILEENGFKPEHTLFIDDSPQHIETAKSLGIQAIYLEKGMTIENDVFLPKDSRE
jgi:putative hydrolase of the HAD superfamily